MADDNVNYDEPVGISDKNLESTSDPDFSGGILAMDHDRPNVTEPAVDFVGPGRPRSAGTMSSVTSNTSAGGACTEYVARGFFSRKSGYFDKAIEAVKTLLNGTQDGAVRGAWLLTEIDHWDNEKEKVFVLTEMCLYICKYDFVAEKLVNSKRLMLSGIEKVQKGGFYYPPKSIMPSCSELFQKMVRDAAITAALYAFVVAEQDPRRNTGLRLSWGSGMPVPNGKKWNPFSDDIPYVTVTSHPLANNEKDGEVASYNHEDFCETFVQELKLVHKASGSTQPLDIVEEAILIESYASLSSLVFNQSLLGFSRERGGVSF